MIRSILTVILITYVFVAPYDSSAQNKLPVPKEAPNVIEVQIPKPKFEIFQAWEYGGFWRWDEKDPRFFKEFLNKIHDSLFLGPF
ncbi:hypothetical protein KKF34_09760 [Myxococcota bacterium]|nr:hypothetical protein [Myxococcota bacterium]MBU1380112.1 hypothetical protein [Myxococcota bacterium]MBU1497150.1 hypothetical protein [Myxococcota bacterium]